VGRNGRFASLFKGKLSEIDFFLSGKPRPSGCKASLLLLQALSSRQSSTHFSNFLVSTYSKHKDKDIYWLKLPKLKLSALTGGDSPKGFEYQVNCAMLIIPVLPGCKTKIYCIVSRLKSSATPI
jgi:hypothetical protein